MSFLYMDPKETVRNRSASILLMENSTYSKLLADIQDQFKDHEEQKVQEDTNNNVA